MQTTDIISKQLIRQVVKDMAVYLLHLDIVDLEEAPTEKQRIETRQADIVMKATDRSGETFILHLELQNTNQSRVCWHLKVRLFLNDFFCYQGEKNGV